MSGSVEEDVMSAAEFRMREAMAEGDFDYAMAPTNATTGSVIDSVDTVTPEWDADYAAAVSKAILHGDPADVEEVDSDLWSEETGYLNVAEDEVSLNALLAELRDRQAS